MVFYSKEDLEVNMVLAKPLFTQNGELLLAKGERLSEQYIKRLAEIGYRGVYVEVAGTEQINPESFLSEAEERKVKSDMSNVKNDITTAIKSADKSGGTGEKKDSKTFLFDQVGNLKNGQGIFKDLNIGARVSDSVSSIVENVLASRDSIDQVSSLRGVSEFFFKHAVDTTIISTLLGIEFGFNKKEINDLAAGALLHNLGMTLLPDYLIHRDDRLSYKEFEKIKKHPEYGFEILRSGRKFSLLAAHVAYQHHERQDGGGFPRGLYGTNTRPFSGREHSKGEIHQYAEIVTVASEYVDMITSKDYRKKRSPAETMAVLVKYAGKIYNSAIVNKFIEIMPIYPQGAICRIIKGVRCQVLGYYGVVAENNVEELNRPDIILIANKEGKRLSKPIRVSLSQRRDIVIKLKV